MPLTTSLRTALLLRLASQDQCGSGVSSLLNNYTNANTNEDKDEDEDEEDAPKSSSKQEDRTHWQNDDARSAS